MGLIEIDDSDDSDESDDDDDDHDEDLLLPGPKMPTWTLEYFTLMRLPMLQSHWRSFWQSTSAGRNPSMLNAESMWIVVHSRLSFSPQPVVVRQSSRVSSSVCVVCFPGERKRSMQR